MPGISDLFCGCSFPSVARPQASVDNGQAPTGPERQQPATSSTCPAPSAGLVQACVYEADSHDDIDVQLSAQLKLLERTFASSLLLRRLGRGTYELDGRRVRLRWAHPHPEAGEPLPEPEVVVREGDDNDLNAAEMPLAAYLQQAADVAASLGGRAAGVPLVARVPQNQRLTFTSVPPQQPLDDMGIERLRSMRMACEQARLREHAAEEYDQRQRERSIGRGTSPAPGVGFGPGSRMRSGSLGSNRGGSAARAPSAEQAARAATPEPGRYSGSAPPTPGLPAPGVSRRGTPPLGTFSVGSARSTSFSRVQPSGGSFARLHTPPPSGPPSRSNSLHNLPSQCRAPGVPPVPVTIVVQDQTRAR